MECRPPILVVGPGRCGTSAVAKMLIELGVFMGKGFVAPSPSNPLGHWEDVEFHDLSNSYIDGRMRRFSFFEHGRRLIAERQSLGVPWGWKDPRTCYLLGEYLRLANGGCVVRCRRDKGEVIESWTRAYGHDADSVEREIDTRNNLLDERLSMWRIANFEIPWSHLFSCAASVVDGLIQFCELTPTDEQIEAAVKSIVPR